MKRLTRNERLRLRYKLFFAATVVVWAAFLVFVVTVPVKSQDAPEAVLEPIAEPVQDDGRIPGDDVPATEYASVEPLEYIGTFKVTAYCSCPECCGIWSAEHPSRIGTDYVQKTNSGTIPQENRTVAADWNVLPSGTEVIMDGQTYIVEDTGAAVNGNHIDIYMGDHQTALEWGVRSVDLYREAK